MSTVSVIVECWWWPSPKKTPCHNMQCYISVEGMQCLSFHLSAPRPRLDIFLVFLLLRTSVCGDTKACECSGDASIALLKVAAVTVWLCLPLVLTSTHNSKIMYTCHLRLRPWPSHINNGPSLPFTILRASETWLHRHPSPPHQDGQVKVMYHGLQCSLLLFSCLVCLL